MNRKGGKNLVKRSDSGVTDIFYYEEKKKKAMGHVRRSQEVVNEKRGKETGKRDPSNQEKKGISTWGEKGT